MKKRLLAIMLIVVIFASMVITASAEPQFEEYEAMTTDALNLRNEDGEILDVIPSMEIVTVIGPEKDSRIPVRWNGMEGTILNKTCKIERRAVTACDLNQRDEKGEILQVIPVNAIVVIKDDYPDSERTLVEYNGKTGTVLSKELNGDFIVIVIKDQLIYMYKNYKIIAIGPTVTGQYGTENETPKGVFSILGKERNKTLTGDDYAVLVNYWMRIYKGIGIHDGDRIRNAYGGNIYTYSGSHGCINVPGRLAEKLYENSYIGMIVIIK